MITPERKHRKNTKFGLMVSLAIYIDPEGHILLQNDTLDEADNLHRKIVYVMMVKK